VVGASGFIGNAVADELEARGVQTLRFTREAPITLPTGELAPGVGEVDSIFWLASSIRPAVTDHAAEDLDALASLLSGLRAEHDGEPRVIIVSSGGTVYDPAQSPPYTESHPTHAANAYGSAMLAAEHTLSTLWGNHVIVRASNAYGPGQPVRRGQGVIAHWLDAVLRGEPIHVIGDPATCRDYVYIDDVVDALIRLSEQAEPPRVINIGSGVPTSLAELADTVGKVVTMPVRVEHSPARGFDAPSTWLDVSLAHASIHWAPRTSLPEGIAATWESVLERHGAAEVPDSVRT
jgi:UDP-glucose 4-epimerase